MRNKAITISPRPMGDMNTVMRDLDMDAGRVTELIEEGKLIAFNIALKKSGRKRLCVLTRSIEHYREKGGKKPLVLEWREIFRLILPHDKSFVNGVEIKRCLNCDSQHVLNLLNAGLLGYMNKRARVGSGGSAIVARTGFENFLKGRLL